MRLVLLRALLCASRNIAWLLSRPDTQEPSLPFILVSELSRCLAWCIDRQSARPCDPEVAEATGLQSDGVLEGYGEELAGEGGRGDVVQETASREADTAMGIEAGKCYVVEQVLYKSEDRFKVGDVIYIVRPHAREDNWFWAVTYEQRGVLFRRAILGRYGHIMSTNSVDVRPALYEEIPDCYRLSLFDRLLKLFGFHTSEERRFLRWNDHL